MGVLQMPAKTLGLPKVALPTDLSSMIDSLLFQNVHRLMHEPSLLLPNLVLHLWDHDFTHPEDLQQAEVDLVEWPLLSAPNPYMPGPNIGTPSCQTRYTIRIRSATLCRSWLQMSVHLSGHVDTVVATHAMLHENL